MLHEKVNIVPVIGKADSLTKNEIAKLKKRVFFFVIFAAFMCFIVLCMFIIWVGGVYDWSCASNSVLFYDLARTGFSLHHFVQEIGFGCW